ncbi:MAG: cysteine desulfurase [Paludibacteraceae bacterium]|nr:cysteine desulfurase [Paludibacteraceae bacterium]
MMKRDDFDILKEKVYGRELVYLDNAATTQKPRQVIDAMVYAYTHFNSNIHRGVHHLSQVATMKHEEARQRVADFINARSKDEIVFTKGTTDSLNMLAFSAGELLVKEGDEIVVSAMEHHSNIVPWQMMCERKGAKLRVIPLREDLTLDMAAYKEMLNEKTRLVSVAQVSNVLGIVNPVEEIVRAAHERGALVAIDAAQSAAHIRIDVQETDCDFMAFSAHKMYGPTGLGVLYGKREWLEKLPPAEGGGEMIEHVSFEKTTYNTLPYKFEAGTPDFIGSYVFGKALEYIENAGRDEIEAHEQELTAYAEERLREIAGMKIYAEGQRKAGVISFNIGDIHPYDTGMLLDRQGVAVRTGHHCAEPLITHLGVPGTVRLSVALYNNKEDIDKLIEALKRAVQIIQSA